MANEAWPETIRALLRAAAEIAGGASGVTAGASGAGTPSPTSGAAGDDRVSLRNPTPPLKEGVALLGLYVAPLAGKVAPGDQQTFLERTQHHAREWAAGFRENLLAALELRIRDERQAAERLGADPDQAVATLEEAVKIVKAWK